MMWAALGASVVLGLVGSWLFWRGRHAPPDLGTVESRISTRWDRE